MISYAQDKEDIILYQLLKGYKGHDLKLSDIRYIDVGANDPERLSVTKLFYDMGAHGINIEPLEDVCAKLAVERPYDINLNYGLGSERGRAKLYVNGMGSSFYYIGAEFETKEVEILTLEDIRQAYKLKTIHFCKIDVEGFEKEVLLGVKDWSKFRPWIFCMESTIAGTYIPNYQEWEYILLENGYELCYEHGINRFYKDKDIQLGEVTL